MEEYAINVAKWLQKMVKKAEVNDPKLRPMKDKINIVTQQLQKANKADVPVLIEKQTQAIKVLMDHLANK